MHILCTDLMACSAKQIVKHALKRGKVDQFYKEAKFLGLGEYRFRESEAALIHAHLVSLTYTLLDVLRRRRDERRVTWFELTSTNPVLHCPDATGVLGDL